jgi:hypothetical protein
VAFYQARLLKHRPGSGSGRPTAGYARCSSSAPAGSRITPPPGSRPGPACLPARPRGPDRARLRVKLGERIHRQPRKSADCHAELDPLAVGITDGLMNLVMTHVIAIAVFIKQRIRISFGMEERAAPPANEVLPLGGKTVHQRLPCVQPEVGGAPACTRRAASALRTMLNVRKPVGQGRPCKLCDLGCGTRIFSLSESGRCGLRSGRAPRPTARRDAIH